MSKPFYKNKLTGNYGVIEGQVLSNQSSSLQLRLVSAVGGMIELSHQHENVTTENLVQVSPEEVQKALSMNYRNHITIEANKRGGKPCVRGLRITVYEVLEYLAFEMTEAEILDDFPDLTREDLKACIAYAADRERRFMTATLSA